MELKTRIWMTGSLEWFAFIDGEEVYLGSREVPIPLDEGDRWVNAVGDVFQVTDGAIVRLGSEEPPKKYW